MYYEFQLDALATSPFENSIVSGHAKGSVGLIAEKKDCELSE